MLEGTVNSSPSAKVPDALVCVFIKATSASVVAATVASLPSAV